MKYPLAVLKRLIDVFGENLCIGYDIMCMFWKIVKKSKIDSLAVSNQVEGAVPLFHGHAHNRLCQVHWHPNYIEGIGKEDLEGCEQVFSASNALAPGTRLASRFHRQQDIEEHLLFWSDNKTFESGMYAK